MGFVVQNVQCSLDTYVHSSVLANHTDKHVGDRDGGQNLRALQKERRHGKAQLFTGPNYNQNKINTDQHRSTQINTETGLETNCWKKS